MFPGRYWVGITFWAAKWLLHCLLYIFVLITNYRYYKLAQCSDSKVTFFVLIITYISWHSVATKSAYSRAAMFGINSLLCHF